jgi:hypothetical protein
MWDNAEETQFLQALDILFTFPVPDSIALFTVTFQACWRQIAS